MKKKIQRISTVGMDVMTWLRHRQNGIGTSEIGIIMGLSPYKSSIELFYEKLGDARRTTSNMAMLLGKEMEPLIADMWEAWDGSEETMIANMEAGIKVRKCEKVNAILTNPDYPWLFTNLDRKIVTYDDRGEGVAEIKTIGGYEADKWEGGVPLPYVMQVMGQMIVTEFEWGEMALLEHGRRWKFDVLPIPFATDIAQRIIYDTNDFWTRVVKGRELQREIYDAKLNFNNRLAEEAEAELVKLEPPADGSDAYETYLKERFNAPDPFELPGTEEEYELAIKSLKVKKELEALKETHTLYMNTIRRRMGNDCTVLNFGKGRGYFSWKPDINNIRRTINKAK
jgi:putative phage-type endonuclease